MLESIFCVPLFTGLIALFLPIKLGRIVLVVSGLLHLQMTLLAWLTSFTPLLPGYFGSAPSGMLVLVVTSFIFLCIAPYSVFYMREQEMQSEPIFIGCMLLFLATMSMAALAEHPIVFWIAVEATTLVSAPLIFINRSKKALEATWKYVLICSVGIALALLGFFFITLSMEQADLDVPLTFSSLNSAARQLDPSWLKTGFIFVLIGFGTKMGLAPMHTWLPDAHSEAPSPASALLSGALLNCAFLGIYKVHTLMVLAGLGDFSGSLLIGFGLFSILVAGIFILNQSDYKRMLAYSSIENMGVIAFGVGIGGLGLYGAMLHLIHHSLLKSSLFLSAGNLVLGFGTKLVARCGGMVSLLPRTFVSFFAGFVGISGLPPFGIFLSELMILLGAFQTGHPLAAGLFIATLVLVLAGFARIVTAMSFSPRQEEVLVEEQTLRIIPPLALLLTSALLCVWMPEPLFRTIVNTIAVIGGTIHG
ncbi:NADH/Ubiquinone/plastoquinone (complex I) [Desulfobulbus propionicus DSM 2032]|jgi:Formate hydrogenlyase subunit 3/Multisubunit Na+/H+ antiporter, MnhD subunit|uniref:NADH/Ubiquinone/plastoquinone (Complex I) n=1 Tax=Desulfobulbus propionicus (strain ATCC 33891 / DSM 2032 / VKM B-1956 / 1pr3) TaxID=577650 RepID=A0A7U3YPT7_DESPD|nr:proton-conducting transporter membrane subunit [Desulfobulbus propionicus]ADW19333.1 NADH/Ubiquinone/plastoquinone (complex I) [Desulfobulbus propionicus DSM 2032]